MVGFVVRFKTNAGGAITGLSLITPDGTIALEADKK